MNILEQIANKRREIEQGVQINIQKSFETDIEKAVYADTYENRKLGRVGQEYKRSEDKQEEKPSKFEGNYSKSYTRISKDDYQKLLDETIDEHKDFSLDTLKSVWMSLDKGEKKRYNDWAQAVDDMSPNQAKLRKKMEETKARKEAIAHLLQKKRGERRNQQNE